MRFTRISFLLVVFSSAPAFGTSVLLNSATSFGLLGGTISNTGTSSVIGNVGATGTVTGFDPTGTQTGTVYSAGPIVAAAYSDFENAFTTASLDPSTTTLAGLTTGQAFLGAGVYAFSDTNVTSTAGITLNFDAQSSSSAVFILQISGALTIDGPITFNLLNGALASNIYWIVGNTTTNDAVTINPSSGLPITWDGNILAGTFTMSAIPGGSGDLAGTINGCVLTVNANTLAGTTQVNGCSSSASTPEPGTAGFLALGALLGALALAKQR
jgi:MYXO-CTERM domain-containing protein